MTLEKPSVCDEARLPLSHGQTATAYNPAALLVVILGSHLALWRFFSGKHEGNGLVSLYKVNLQT